MSSGRWIRVQRIFEEALEQRPDARVAFLEDACAGDLGLADDVRALLAAHEQSGDLVTLPGSWLDALGEPDPPRFTPGERIADRYEIRGLLGLGGMGEVYEAWDDALSIAVAMKAFRVAFDSEESHRRLKMEGLLARSVWHPNSCRIYDLGRHEDTLGTTWFLTMEKLEGVTLFTRLKAVGRMPPELVCRFAVQLAGALGASHRAGVVHRDFKPGNVILVERDGSEQAVVTDFGIARLASEVEGNSPHDGTGQVIGTPAFMAPEQVRGEPAGPAADIYALGVVLYEMVTGRLPFQGGSALEVARRRLSEDPPSPRSVVPDLDERWEAVILRCLERDPRRRFSHAEAVSAALLGRTASRKFSPASSRSIAPFALPPEQDDFVGRGPEMDALDREFASGTKLITLVGSPGVGKTRLAIRYGWRALETWPGGVWFFDLREARDVPALASAVARALGLSLGRLDPIEQLGQAIAARGRCLLILDNVEQVVEHAATSVRRWMEQTNEALFLVTSRERLRLENVERVQPVEPLSTEAAMDLFIARALWLLPSLELRGSSAATVREIVGLLDGMPLAIELAAARVRVMTMPQILEHMRDRFRLLTGGRTTRHETLEVAIDGSWELLTPWEKSTWAQGSVFEDGFTLEAAEHVLDLHEWPDAPAVVDILQSLVDRSLVRAAAGPGAGGTEARFGMYVSLLEYAHQRLRQDLSGSGQVHASDAAERRHGQWYARYGTDEAIEKLDRLGGAELRRALGRELPNLIAASRCAVMRGDGEVATAAYRAAVEVLAMRGPFSTAIELGLEILERADLRVVDRAWVLQALARVERLAGTHESARAHSQEGLALARATPDRRLEAHFVGWLGNLDYDEGAHESARAHYEEALAIYREEADDRGAGIVLSHLGLLDAAQGQYETARARYQSALALLRQSGDIRREGPVHAYLGSLHRARGRFPEALAEFSAALAMHREVGDHYYEYQAIGNMGNLHVEMGHDKEARFCYESAVAMAHEAGDRRNEGLFLTNLGHLHFQHGRVDEARFCAETALAHHRRAGTPMYEGYALSLLGRLSHHLGRVEQARNELAEAEAVLREAGHPTELAKVLCLRGTLELESSNPSVAKAVLDEVESMANAWGWGPEGEAGGMIAKLRDAIHGN